MQYSLKNPVQQYNLFESGATYTHENQTLLCKFLQNITIFQTVTHVLLIKLHY